MFFLFYNYLRDIKYPPDRTVARPLAVDWLEAVLTARNYTAFTYMTVCQSADSLGSGSLAMPVGASHMGTILWYGLFIRHVLEACFRGRHMLAMQKILLKKAAD